MGHASALAGGLCASGAADSTGLSHSNRLIGKVTMEEEMMDSTNRTYAIKMRSHAPKLHLSPFNLDARKMVRSNC